MNVIGRLRDALLAMRTQELIAAIARDPAYPGCWFCQRGTARGHLHIERSWQR